MPIIQTNKELRPRDPDDFYPTPVELARAIMVQYNLDGKNVVDAGAGEGAWGEAVRQLSKLANIIGVEKTKFNGHPDYDRWVIQDFLNYSHKCDIVMGNPPYRQAEAFVRHALTIAPHVVFLLRLSFLEGQRRSAGLYKEHFLRRVLVCGRRPSFTGNGKTNYDAYAVYHFMSEKYYFAPTLGWLDWNYDD